MERLIAITNKIVHGCLFFLTFLLIFTTATQILFRVFLGLPMSWTEEVGRYSFIWWVFFGAVLGLRDRRHLGIDVVVRVFPERLLRYWDMGIHLLILSYLAVMLFQGLKLVKIQMIHRTPITNVPLGWIISVIPICALLMGLYVINLMRKK